MIIVKELLTMGLKRTLDSGQVNMLVKSYLTARFGADKPSWRDEEGAKSLASYNELEARTKPIISLLTNIESHLYYPTRVESVNEVGHVDYKTIKNRDEMYAYLIEGIENEK